VIKISWILLALKMDAFGIIKRIDVTMRVLLKRLISAYFSMSGVEQTV
jgi:hypothetical protein